jgi:hypothetical protein
LYGANPQGTVSYVIQLDDAITIGKSPADLTVCLDHDGSGFLHATAAAFGYSQAWHKVDASRLELRDGRISGPIIVVLKGDWWTTPNPSAGSGIAVRIELDATGGGQAVNGTYRARLGVPWAASGPVSGTATDR